MVYIDIIYGKMTNEDVSIYITTHVTSDEQLRMLVTGLRHADRWYPREKITVIDDNSSYKVNWGDLKKIHKNMTIIHVPEKHKGSGEPLRLYYYLTDKSPTEWAICIHDSQFINSRFSLPIGIPYQFLFTAKHI